MIPEILKELRGVPDGIVTSVGGGGLFAGIMIGLEKEGGRAERPSAGAGHGNYWC
jgi:threonine dehydratase